MTVLSDEQLRAACGYDITCDHVTARAIERATIAALAARGGVDVEALALTAYDGLAESVHPRDQLDPIREAIRLALAQQAACYETERVAAIESFAAASRQHEAREARWRELRELERSYWLAIERSPLKAITSRDSRIDELRRELGVE